MYILKDYDKVLVDIMEHGKVTLNDRTGVGRKSLIGVQCRYDISTYFPLPTKRKYAYKSIFAELLWMLSGSTNVNDLEAMNSKIWSAWRDEKFEERNAYGPGALGPIYGHQFRNFGGKYYANGNGTESFRDGFDQVWHVIDQIKNNPTSTRHMINLWDANVMHSDKVKLPCCHFAITFHVQDDTLSAVLHQRSGDWLPGCSANVFFYTAFTYMIAQLTSLKPGELIHNVDNAHIYLNQIEAVEEYLKRPEVDSPILKLNKKEHFYDYKVEDFVIENYNPLPAIKVPVAV